MTSSFLHGVETFSNTKGTTAVVGVDTAVVGIIGTAPIYQLDTANQSVNQLKYITNQSDAVKYFGTDVAGFTIPSAIKAIYAHGAGTIIAVNVFDPTKHKTDIAETQAQFTAGVINLGHTGITNLVVKSQDDATTYVLGTHYTLDANAGTITVISKADNSIAANATVKVAYSYADISKVTPADIIGTVDASGQRTGIQALKDCYSKFGTKVKIIISPVYCALTGVRDELVILAENQKAFTYVDAPVGTTFEQAIAGRGPDGTINFNTNSGRTMLCFPQLTVYDNVAGVNKVEPYSQRLAGVRVATDLNYGFWYSASNKPIVGISGMERPITFGLDDASCEANQLNSKGIVTVINDYGTGYRTWGNRSAAFPSSNEIDTFECVQRTADYIDESIQQASMNFVDLPIDKILVEELVNKGNATLRVLKGKGAIVSGSCWYDPAKNDASELAGGHIVISRSFCPPPPAERITYESTIDIYLLNSI